jgi:hypothetical protein
MRAYIIALVFCVTGCSTTVPVTAKFPERPKATPACPQLETVKEDVKISEFINTVTKNYGTYYECAVKVDTWNEWYETQKRIFESVK